eukprot:1395526-Amorphochlora_amoeboformis.AAC.3
MVMLPSRVGQCPHVVWSHMYELGLGNPRVFDWIRPSDGHARDPSSRGIRGGSQGREMTKAVREEMTVAVRVEITEAERRLK